MPRAGLSCDAIVTEAARLVDEVGAERLTLSELARRFGVAQPSLYKHVDGVDGLHRLLAVRVLGDIAEAMRRAGTGKAGADAISALAVAYRTYALAHPGCYAYAVRAPAPGDTALESVAADILSIFDDVFASHGITGSDAVDATRFVRSALHGFVSLELGGGFGIPHSANTSFRRLVAATNRALRDW